MLARKALAGTAGAPKVYVEEVFSTYLYTGTNAAQTIANGIDLSGEGGLVWIKSRTNNAGTGRNTFTDTARGARKPLITSSTAAEDTLATSTQAVAFASNGFTLGTTYYETNYNGDSVCSWTFRKAKKFFDVVTYTGNGTTKTISHNLGSTPGCIIVKESSASGNDWQVYHRSTTNTCGRLFLNLTNAENANNRANTWGDNTNPIPPTSTEFTVGNTGGVNNNGSTYVAYLFAHDAGGFGDAGSDSIIKCGSYTGNGSAPGPTITLDWEPQWIMIKRTDSTGNWLLYDNMRGWPVGSDARELYANDSYQEDASSYNPWITSTGFYPRNADSRMNASGGTYIYIAIRRGPMKTPTSGTSVYSGVARTGTGATATVTGVGFPSDLVLLKNRSSATAYDWNVYDRLRGATIKLATNSTNLESTETNGLTSLANMDGYTIGPANEINASTVTFINYSLRRAPGFFDVVCYTGTGSARTVSHNLGVVPELMIVKSRTTTDPWPVYHVATGNNGVSFLNSTSATGSDNEWNYTTPTSSVFSVGAGDKVNGSGQTYVAYLFASVSGVSKVGSYTGNGSSVTVTTDFQPRFIMVKRKDSTGNWIVGDSARGLVSADEPALFLNSTAAETTGQDWVDVSSTGFTVNETALNANVNTATYIYLCVA